MNKQRRCPSVGLTGIVMTVLLSGMGLSVPPAEAAKQPRPAVAIPARADSVAERTKQVQFLLRSYGYTIAVDGVYGPQTARVVRAWQKANGLAVDGLAGVKTWESLITAVPSAATATVPAVRVSPPAPGAQEPVGDTESIIREVWPDNLEDQAVRIAKRESGPNLKVDAANACCYGIFQIHFRAHRAWLANYGVHQPSDLFDPRVNATVAFALYQEAGWAPWNL